MSKPLVLHTDPIRHGQQLWEEFESDYEVVHFDEHYKREQFIEDLHGKYSNVVAIARGYLAGSRLGRFDDELIQHFPDSLRYIAHQGAGYDQCDVSPLSKRSIQLSHCPDIVNKSTADTNIFLMLGAMRNFQQGTRLLMEDKWPTGGFGAGSKEGINPTRKVLGIIGMGGIGCSVRDRARTFGFEKIVYYNRSRLSPEAEEDSEYCDSLEKLIRVSDVLSLNCPLNSSTNHLINDELISKMKDGVIIVNTARGAVIDEKALIKHLKTGKVAAAGLDVYEKEPHPPRELLEMNNVICTPHMGTHAVQTVYDMEKCVIDNVKAGLSTGKVINLVPEQKGLF
jgi:gluconate 2-dehydrogenase